MNWLPPLLDPIAVNYTTAAVPMIDSLSPYTLEYQNLGHGARGSFDWTLTYQWLLLTEEYQKAPGDNYQLSVMTGGAFAINRKWFFHLGGYDEGLMVSYTIIFFYPNLQIFSITDLEWRKLGIVV